VVFCIVDINQRNALMSMMTINFTTPPRNYFTTTSAPKQLLQYPNDCNTRQASNNLNQVHQRRINLSLSAKSQPYACVSELDRTICFSAAVSSESSAASHLPAGACVNEGDVVSKARRLPNLVQTREDDTLHK
jgi:hypothetical protein